MTAHLPTSDQQQMLRDLFQAPKVTRSGGRQPPPAAGASHPLQPRPPPGNPPGCPISAALLNASATRPSQPRPPPGNPPSQTVRPLQPNNQAQASILQLQQHLQAAQPSWTQMLAGPQARSAQPRPPPGNPPPAQLPAVQAGPAPPRPPPRGPAGSSIPPPRPPPGGKRSTGGLSLLPPVQHSAHTPTLIPQPTFMRQPGFMGILQQNVPRPLPPPRQPTPPQPALLDAVMAAQQQQQHLNQNVQQMRPATPLFGQNPMGAPAAQAGGSAGSPDLGGNLGLHPGAAQDYTPAAFGTQKAGTNLDGEHVPERTSSTGLNGQSSLVSRSQHVLRKPTISSSHQPYCPDTVS